MAISQKRKRKLIYDGDLYLWYVKEDDDFSSIYRLHIMSEDGKMNLIYRVDQISDDVINPEIFVEKSDRLQRGWYRFWPPLADESISNHNVRKILDWYKELR
jgi:hypothetical protein